jgi:phage shock protein A
MSILDRINTLIRANVNDLVHRSDEPERALDRSIGDMQSSVGEARGRLRQCEQNEAQLHQQWRRAREESLEWEDKAMDALRQGDERLARELLVVKKKVDRRVEALREQLEQQRDYVADLSRSLDALQVKLEAVRSRRHSISRHVSGPGADHAPGRVGAATLPFDQDPPASSGAGAGLRGRQAFALDDDMRREYPEEVFGAGQTFSEFERVGDRIRQDEADALAGLDDPLRDDLQDRFSRLERDRDLRDLRSRARDQPGAGASRGEPSGGLSDLRRQLAEELDG